MNDAGNIADGLIKDHLLAKGFSNSFRTYEQDLKNDKEGKLQVETFVEDTLSAIEKLDIEKLSTIWATWSTRVFNSLSGEKIKVAKQYETDVYRLYLVRCVQKKELTKCTEFFQKMSAQTQNNPLWTDWFAFPYNPNPQDCPVFRKYFDKQWREIFVISLHNFLSIVVNCARRTQLTQLMEALEMDTDNTAGHFEEELIDDFAVIAQCSGPMKASQSKPSLKNLLRSLTSKKSGD